MADEIGVHYRVDDSELIASLRNYDQSMQNFKDKNNEFRQGAKKNFDRVGDSIDENDRRLKKHTKTVSNFGSVFKGVFAAEIAQQALRNLSQQISKAKESAAAYEDLTTSFETFLGSTAKAKKVLKDLDLFSRGTPFSPDQVNKAGKALLAFGVAERKLIPTLKAIGDVSAATGKNFNELAVIYGKARTQGTLFAEDINQLTEAGIPIIAELANQFDVAESQVKKLGSEGKITFADLEVAFNNMTGEGGRFNNLMEKQGQNLNALESNAKGAFNTVLRLLGGKMLPVLKLVNRVSAGISEVFIRWLSDSTSAAQEQIKTLRTENATANTLFRTLRGLNDRVKELEEGTEEYNIAIQAKKDVLKQINTEYGEYLPNLLDEKSSLKEIELAQKAVNREFVKRQLLIAFEEEMQAAIQKEIEARKELVELEKEQAERNTFDTDSTGAPVFKGIDESAGTAQLERNLDVALPGIIDKQQQIVESAQKTQESVTEEYRGLAENMGIAFEELLNVLNGTQGETGSVVPPGGKKETDEATDALDRYKSALLDLQSRANDFDLKNLTGADKLRKEWELTLQELTKLKDELKKFADEAGIEFDPGPINELIEKYGKKYREGIQKVLKLEPLPPPEVEEPVLPDDASVEINVEPKIKDLEGFENQLAKAIGDSLNLDAEQYGQFKSAISEAYSNVNDIIAASTEAQLNSNQEILDSLRDRISETESAVEEEQKKQEKGYANNVEAKKMELERLKAEEKKAEEERQKLKKQSLKQQLIQQSLAQAANLATAITKIFNANAGIPIVGIALAAAAVTGLIASFKKFKSQANKVTTDRLYKGGPVDQFLQGYTDRNNGKGHKVEDSNLVLGGEEYVLNGKTTKKNRPFIEKLNRGEFDNIDIQKTLKVGQLFQSDIQPPGLTAEYAQNTQKMNEEIGRERRSTQSQVDLAIEKAMNNHLKGMKAYFDKRPQYIPKKKGYIEKSKGVTRHVDLD